MHQFVEDVAHLGIPALGVFLERAKGLYEENMSTYVKMILRRSFGRFMVSWEEGGWGGLWDGLMILADRTSSMGWNASHVRHHPMRYTFMLHSHVPH
jgi:hypothetical protein